MELIRLGRKAKGRVERINGTLQGRLVKALRGANISHLETANLFERRLSGGINARFEVAAAVTEDWHRPLSAGMDLSLIVSIQESRVVAKDWTLRSRNRVMRLPRENSRVVRSGQA